MHASFRAPLLIGSHCGCLESAAASSIFVAEATTSPIMDIATGTARPRRTPMAWVYLLFAGLLEIVWAYEMKQSHGFTRLAPSAITIGAMIGSVGLLALAMRTLPLGTSYMIWTGIGAVGAFVVGIAFLGEAVSMTRIVAAAFIIVGLILMKAASPA